MVPNFSTTRINLLTSTLLISVVCYFLAINQLQAQDDGDRPIPVKTIFDEANAAYEANNFNRSTELYQRAVSEGYAADLLYLNLGTSHFRNGSPGKAALWYRRAAHINPSLPDIQQNFEYLRSSQGILEFGTKTWEQTLRRVSPLLLIWIAWLSLWVTLFCLLVFFLTKRRRVKPILVLISCFAIANTIFFFAIGYYRKFELAPSNFATVIDAESSAYSAPAPLNIQEATHNNQQQQIIIQLPEGSEVKILENTGPWFLVLIPESTDRNLVGWVHHSSIEPNWPIPTTN